METDSNTGKRAARQAAPGKMPDMGTFAMAVKKELEMHFGSGYRVWLHDVMLDNNVPSAAVDILHGECRARPSFCLDSLYRKYLDGRADIKDVCGFIIRASAATWENAGTMHMADFEKMRGRICLRLINAEWNRKMLESMPHTRFFDLAAVYCIHAAGCREGTGQTAVDRSMLDMWQADTVTLHALALANTQRMYRPRLFPLDASLPGMFLATNHTCINGASVILYDGFLSGFAKKQCCSFYVLPSSVNYMLLIPEHYVQDAAFLRNILECTTAGKHCRKEERLSGSIYYYDWASGRLGDCPDSIRKGGF